MRFSWLFGVMYNLAKIEGRDLVDSFHQKFCLQVYILTLSSNGLLYVKSTIARDLKAANSLAASELFEAIFCFVTHPMFWFELRFRKRSGKRYHQYMYIEYPKQICSELYVFDPQSISYHLFYHCHIVL